jgi:hypothetical protein
MRDMYMRGSKMNGSKIREPTLEELDARLTINEHKLEEEAAIQPDMFYRVAKRLALEISRRDAAKQGLEDVEARVDVDIRRMMEQDEAKITEKAIDSQKRLHPKVKEARQLLLDATQTVGEWGALREAYQQRSYAIAHLVDLYIRNYYGEITRDNRQKNRDAQYAREHSRYMRHKSERQ